jgi:DNA polymerase III alpha subunit (gram-positive type)
MINNINKNSYNMNLYGKSPTKSNDEIKQIENKLSAKINMGELAKGELTKINKFQDAEVTNFLKEIKEQIKKAELIAIKIVKGEKVTADEQRFISEKYPDMKQIGEQSIKECKDLKEQLKNCKTDEERQQVLFNTISDVEDMAKKGAFSEIQVRIKMSAIEELKKQYEKDNNKEKESKFNINQYIYLNSGALVDKLIVIMIIVVIISILYMF